MIAKAVRQSFSSAGRRAISSKPTFVPTCPPATQCCVTLPSGLDIDRESPLWGRLPFYSNHLVVSTGSADWTSKIEDDPSGWFAADLKREFLNRRQVEQVQTTPTSKAVPQALISCSSFPPTLKPRESNTQTIGVFSFPRSEYTEIQIQPNAKVSLDAVAGEIIRHNAGSSAETSQSLSHPPSTLDHYSKQGAFSRPAYGVTVLICGHGGRDQRCGIIGPLLREEFIIRLRAAGFAIEDNPSDAIESGQSLKQAATARVGLISHIGGHKWAGNVIIYVSPKLATHNLGGMGIWYGRVEPQHVEGIVEETLLNGRIIDELCRGGIRLNGQPLERY